MSIHKFDNIKFSLIVTWRRPCLWENDASRAHTGPPAPKNASPSRPTASPTLQAAASSSRSPSYLSPGVELEDSLLPAPLQKSQRAVATAAADVLLRTVIGSRRPKEPESRRTGPRREDARHTAAAGTCSGTSNPCAAQARCFLFLFLRVPPCVVNCVCESVRILLLLVRSVLAVVVEIGAECSKRRKVRGLRERERE